MKFKLTSEFFCACGSDFINCEFALEIDNNISLPDYELCASSCTPTGLRGYLKKKRIPNGHSEFKNLDKYAEQELNYIKTKLKCMPMVSHKVVSEVTEI